MSAVWPLSTRHEHHWLAGARIGLHAGPIYEHEGSGQEDPHNLAVRPRCVNGYLSKYKMLYVVTSYRPMIQSGDTSYLDAAPVAAQLLRPT
jgi:hypothetical protein